MKKTISLFLTLFTLLAFASCNKSNNENKNETYTEITKTTTESISAPTETDINSNENIDIETTAKDDEEEDELLFKDVVKFNYKNHDADPSKWTTEEIVACYKSAMAMEDHSDVQTDQSFELIGDLTGKASILKEPIKLAMKLASKPFGALPGGYWDLEASDLKSADAHKEGDYVVINLYPKEQVDGPNGNEHEGTVGHVTNVVQGIDEFINYVEKNFSVLNAKYDDDSVVLKYSDAYAKNVKINTKTGKMESGTWGYTVDIYLDHCSMAGINFENFHTTIRWKCWYPVTD